MSKDSEVDIAVIGGGFAGLSAARYLKQAAPTLTVALLEGSYVGFGASGRNAGGVSLLPPLTWLMHDGDTLGDIQWATNYIRAQIHEWTAWVRQEGIDCDLRPTPMWITAGSRFQAAIVRWLAERCKALRCQFEWLTEAEMRGQLGSPAQSSIVLDGYTVQPYRLARGLLDILLRRGVQVYENTRISSIRAGARGVELLTAAGARLTAEKVVLATNAYSSQLDVGYKLPSAFSLHTYMMATVPLERALLERLLYEGKFVADASTSFYYGRVFGNRLVFGGTDRISRVTAADDQHEGSFRKLHQELCTRFPYLADVRLDVAWGGPFQQRNSETPIVQTLEANPNIILNIGYGGSGVALSQLSGKMVQGLVLGEKQIDSDAEKLRQIYATSTLPIAGLARSGMRILRHMIWR